MRYLKNIVANLAVVVSILSCSEPSSSDTVMVCISKTSYKYHARSCKGVKTCTHEIKKIPISEAEQMGKTPCGFCY